jgi:hypothetical protein
VGDRWRFAARVPDLVSGLALAESEPPFVSYWHSVGYRRSPGDLDSLSLAQSAESHAVVVSHGGHSQAHGSGGGRSIRPPAAKVVGGLDAWSACGPRESSAGFLIHSERPPAGAGPAGGRTGGTHQGTSVPQCAVWRRGGRVLDVIENAGRDESGIGLHQLHFRAVIRGRDDVVNGRSGASRRRQGYPARRSTERAFEYLFD